MSSEEAVPLVAAGRVEPVGAGGFRVEKGDYGAFRAVEPGTHDLVLLRPERDGLAIERPIGRERVAWEDVASVELGHIAAGSARVPHACLRLRSGSAIEVADALAPGSDHLPFATRPGGPPLFPVERFRLLVATVVAAAGLAPTAPGRFERAERAVDLQPVTPRPKVLPRWAQPALLVLSVVVLWSVFEFSATSAVVLTAVIFLHEIGHALAMKWTGMQVRGVLFLPFLGAATLPEHTFRSRWDEVRVTLAGPLTGLPVALVGWALLQVDGIPPGVGRDTILFGLVVNLLNLIPLLPLDGGRLLIGLAAGLPTASRAFVSFLPPVSVFVVLLFMAPQGLALFVSVLLAFSFVMTRTALRRQGFHQWMLNAEIPLRKTREALRDITHALSGIASEDADGGVAVRPLSVAQSGLTLALYMASVLVLTAATFVAQLLVSGLGESVSAA